MDPEVVESEAVTTSRWELLVEPTTQFSEKPSAEQANRSPSQIGRWTEELHSEADDDDEDLDGQWVQIKSSSSAVLFKFLVKLMQYFEYPITVKNGHAY